VEVVERSDSLWSHLAHLRPTYSEDAEPTLPKNLFLKYGNDGRSEVLFHNQIAKGFTTLPVVPCYEAVFSQETDKSHLLMLDLSETHGEMAPWPLPPRRRRGELIVECFARLHACWWEHAQLNRGVGRLPEALESNAAHREAARWWQEQYARFRAYLADRLTDDVQCIYDRLLAALPALWGAYWEPRVKAMKALTLIHGDAHPGNLMCPRDESADGVESIYLIDWQGYRVGTGATDLAYMVTCHWHSEEEQARPFLKHYYRALTHNGVTHYSWDNFWLDYQMAIVYYLLDPLRLFSIEAPALVWWPILHKCLTAYRQYHCANVLPNLF
jgi:hypothetical protein